jgi:hypothetical protein
MMIDLSPDGVKKVEIEPIDEPSPDDEVIIHTLRALYFIGQELPGKTGFWTKAGDIVKWLEANGIKDEEGEPYTTQRVGLVLRTELGFTKSKRVGPGKIRWIKRDRLMGLIEKYNNDEDREVADTAIEAGYEKIKREVFELLLRDGDVQELKYDLRQVKKAMQEYVKMGEKKAKEWLEGG